jgi:Heme oxygenase
MDLKTDGLAFYEFDQIASAKLFKDEFRAAMDALRLPPGDVDRLVHEANIAFLLNMRIFEVLDVKANFPGSSVRSLGEVLAFEPSATGSNECPFAKPSAGGGGGVPNARCPWPFIFLHDPVAALRDWQTWALLGVLLSMAWRFLDSSSY